MTRDEFIAQHLDEWAGQLLDAAVSQRSGAELSLWTRQAYQRLRARLGAMYDQMCPATNGHANGKPAARPATQPARN